MVSDSLDIDSNKVVLVDSLQIKYSMEQRMQMSRIDSLFSNIKKNIKFIKSKKRKK